MTRPPIQRRAVLWLIPAFLALHNAEEAIAFRRYLPLVSRRLPAEVASRFGVTYPQMLAALAIVTVVPFLVIAWAARRPDEPRRLWWAVLLQVVVMLNVVSHVAAAAFLMRGYSPGLATALLVNLPFSLYLLRRAVHERWIGRRALAMTVPAAVLVHGPLLAGAILLAGSIAG